MQPNRSTAVVLLVCLATAACSNGRVAGNDPVEVQASPPLARDTNGYEAATSITLPEVAPTEHPNLHNVYKLSDSIFTGSEPADEAALAMLADWGVKTILSTDGKAPDAKTAAKYGMEYVHVPIQYKGITTDEQMRIIKTFREKEGPFFVHCFHGKHRGPAGAALGRLVLDGVTREQALAEMRQWCGTSNKYSGLYWTIATAELPTAAESRSYEWDFPAAAPLDGVAGAMVPIARHYENVLYADVVDYGVDPAHPDIDPLNEAVILNQLFAALARTDEVRAESEDYRGWMTASVTSTEDLVAALRDHRAAPSESTRDAVEDALDATQRSCSECHSAYRNR